jgi:transcriptional regulator with XRE-family HTH domain
LLVSKRRREPTTRFGRYLRQHMDAQGFDTDAELARAAAMDASMISKWQSGEAAPTIPKLRQVAGPLKVRLVDLLVEADILTAEEIGMAGAPTTPPLPAPLSRVLRIVNDPNVSQPERDHLLRAVEAALEFWATSVDIPTPPREPSAAERSQRAQRGGRPVDR